MAKKMKNEELVLEIMSRLVREDVSEAHTTWLLQDIGLHENDRPELHNVLQTLRTLGMVELREGTEEKRKDKWWRASEFQRCLAKRIKDPGVCGG